LIFFVISTGRTGTHSISKAFTLEWERDGQKLSIERFRERAEAKFKEGWTHYGSVSSFLKYHIPELKKNFPKAVYVHLVRNGIGVVKSLVNREHYRYTKDHPEYRNQPLPIEGFEELTRFEKLCHWWNYWNKAIESEVSLRVRLEDIQHLMPVTNPGKPHTEFTHKETRLFNVICSETMLRYGYQKADYC